MESMDQEIVRITVSGSVAQLDQDESPEGLIKRVDDCLYDAKKGGRNQIVQSR